MPSRYSSRRTVVNDNEYYAPIRRGNKTIIHHDTPILYMPSTVDRAALRSQTHFWRYGDRYYKLANQYYGDARLWWVIAWYNAIPTEASIKNGDVIEIPLNIQETLRTLGA